MKLVGLPHVKSVGLACLLVSGLLFFGCSSEEANKAPDNGTADVAPQDTTTN